MKGLCVIIFSCSVLWGASARSQGVARPEIDFLEMDIRWSLSELDKYMSGKYSDNDHRYDTSGILWGMKYDSVYCGGMLGELYSEQIDSEIRVLFSSPIYLGHGFALPDTSDCIDDGYLPSREKYEKLTKTYTSSLEKKSFTEFDGGEASTFKTGRARLELRYDKVRPVKGEIVLIHLYP